MKMFENKPKIILLILKSLKIKKSEKRYLLK